MPASVAAYTARPCRCPPARTGPRRRGGAGTSAAARSSGRRPRPPAGARAWRRCRRAGHAEHQDPGRNTDGRPGHDRQPARPPRAPSTAPNASADADGGLVSNRHTHLQRSAAPPSPVPTRAISTPGSVRPGHGLAVTLSEAYGVAQEDELAVLWQRGKSAAAGIRRCPMCESAMAVVSLDVDDDEQPEGAVGDGQDTATVKVDLCPPCQVLWFDSNELAGLPTDQPDASRAPTSSPTSPRSAGGSASASRRPATPAHSRVAERLISVAARKPSIARLLHRTPVSASKWSLERPISRRTVGSDQVQPALCLVGAAPAAGAGVLAVADRGGAGHAADRRVALLVSGLTGTSLSAM